MEAGFGNTHEEIVHSIKEVVSLGAIGINFEDGTGNKASPMTPITEQANKIRAIRAEFSPEDLWINARIDVFYLGLLGKEDALMETIKRAHAYLDSGANSIFIFGVNDKDLIARLVNEIKAPINLLANPYCPSMEELKALGIARVSLGSSPMRATLGLLEEMSHELLKFGTYRSLTDKAVSYPALQALFN